MDKLIEAIQFATEKHQNQKRRDGVTPFISHPLAVALILSEITRDSDVIVAGILHDVTENAGIKKQELVNKFGERVAHIVTGCSEEDTSLDWQTRKSQALAAIKSMDEDTALVKTADILHNLVDSVKQVGEYGIGFLDNFHVPAKEKFAYERLRLEEFKQCHAGSPLIHDIEKNLSLLEALLFT